ncbi:hypothetical protein IQ226_11575 [Dolichospermum sp. LEGE 00240]|jgi:molybdopterin-binding protein|uniref:hypothetical protein n=1 Tax=Dolichospermum sp. LEGE 00240 TaxID=1828603 RepID=UPI0018801E95|nr:hypothetical protein [Dolichospermum sp. LEGE 00240]MBE9249790.1 hypothetical protein [Dolichospermum sp. LEGE 00240]MDM3845550.1 hypothetical protein [Aphanizomenon gracile PMC638.10]MDM3858886.1 hypothetical protein [Aphanizomenon gracile PMC644.10]
MKKSISPIALIFSCVSLIACTTALKDTLKEEASAVVTQNQMKTALVVASEQQNKQASYLQSETQEKKEPVGKNLDNNKNTKKGANQQPTEGKVKKIVNGDLMCYVTLVDNKGIEHNVGASFEICDEKKFLNKKVRVVYQVKSVNDCQSAEPCGKTRKQSIITKMEVVNESSKKGTNQQPTEGKVKKIVNGDLMCYVTLVDNKGIEHNVGASFEICDEKKFLNKKVRVVYQVESVNDCQSIEPCGKTRKQSIITKMEVVNESSKKKIRTP